jgi:uncharacterized protein (UPF0548 family)
MRFARSSDSAHLDAFLASKLDAPLSYAEVGASLVATPPGYHHDAGEIVLGHDARSFARARQGIREWQAHRGAGVTVHPADAPLEIGTTIALALPFVAVQVLAACRIVAVIDQPSRYGFAYGTVVGHPERGEESFLIEQDDGTVRFRVAAFSRPADPLARLGAPVARRIQRRVTLAYLTGLRSWVSSPPA